MEDTTTRWTTDYDADLGRLHEERAEHQAKIGEIDRLIQALELVRAWKTNQPLPAALLQGPSLAQAKLPTGERPSNTHFSAHHNRWPTRLRGLTQTEALVYIAENNNGMLRVTDARDIFVEARLARGKPRNVPGHIHHLLRNSDRFEYVEPGVFRLVPQEVGTPTSAPRPPDTDVFTGEEPQSRLENVTF